MKNKINLILQILCTSFDLSPLMINVSYYLDELKGYSQCDQKKSPNVYKSCPTMISLEK